MGNGKNSWQMRCANLRGLHTIQSLTQVAQMVLAKGVARML